MKRSWARRRPISSGTTSPTAARVWREFFDRGRLHIETDERRVDGTPVPIEGDYLCFYDDQGRITGHFGIQRDVTQRDRADRALRQLQPAPAGPARHSPRHPRLALFACRSRKSTIRHVQSLIPCRRVSVAVIDVPRAIGQLIALARR